MKLTISAVLAVGLAGALIAAETTPPSPPPPTPTPGWRFEELRRFKAPEAGQGVAVDRECFYAINNRTVAKYRKDTGARVAIWTAPNDGEVVHLNAGVVVDGRLHAAHSNFPAIPMLSSVEVFDVATMQHVGTHSLGRMDGSLTWLDRREKATALGPGSGWIACFVHYGTKAAEPSRDPAWTQIVAFDDSWRRTAGWGLPPALLARIANRGYSASGGAFGPGGHLYLTGHDNPELYVLEFPAAGSILKWIATVPIPAEGQAFAWDPSEPGVLFAIVRRTREVVAGRITPP